MFEQEKIQKVMSQTGADRETAEAALNTSDGNVDIAVRIINSYNLKHEAKGGNAGEAEQAGSAEQTGSAEKSSQAEQSENRPPKAQDIIDAIKAIWRRGNASRLDIEKNERVILSVSLTVGTIGLVIAPVAAIIGLGTALITDYTIKITLDNGSVINVNEFAVTHKIVDD